MLARGKVTSLVEPFVDATEKFREHRNRGVVEIAHDTDEVSRSFASTHRPEPERQGKNFEFSIAVAKSPTHPWAVALLRHLCRYQLSTDNELMVGDVMPCHAPITYIPFPPQHHASMPPTDLDSIVVVDDPVLGAIDTPHGPIGVRRIVGVTMQELRVIGAEPPDQCGRILGETNPDFVTVL